MATTHQMIFSVLDVKKMNDESMKPSNEVTKEKNMKPKIRCPNCGSSQAYIRIKTGQIVCHQCGEVTLPKGYREPKRQEEAA
jgi:ribosomal protein L37AE/L43A